MLEREQRLRQELLQSVFSCGLRHSSPKVLLAIMRESTDTDTIGLTTEHIKSHLQKYRLNFEKSSEEFDSFAAQHLTTDFAHVVTRAAGAGAGAGSIQVPAAAGAAHVSEAAVTEQRDAGRLRRFFNDSRELEGAMQSLRQGLPSARQQPQQQQQHPGGWL